MDAFDVLQSRQKRITTYMLEQGFLLQGDGPDRDPGEYFYWLEQGWVSVSPYGLLAAERALWHVEAILVQPAARGRGLGAQILKRTMQAARAARACLILHVEPFGETPSLDADELHAWYLRAGFQERLDQHLIWDWKTAP